MSGHQPCKVGQSATKARPPSQETQDPVPPLPSPPQRPFHFASPLIKPSLSHRRTSSMSGVPYIGAKISLISRSEIRYEGVLAEVDPKEATIGLEHVMMMGTEDRKSGHEFVPMNPQVYDFIVFRSTDIKDLQVCEVPQPQAPQMHYMDPAIVNQQQYYQQTVQQQQQPAQQMQPPKLQFGSGRSPVVEASYVPAPVAPQQQQPQLKFGSGPSMAQAVSQPKGQVSQPPAEPMQPPKVHPAAASNVVSMTPKADAKAEQKAAASATNEQSKVLTYSTGTKKQEFVENKGQFAPPPTKGSYAAMASLGTNPSGSSTTRASLERPGKFRAPAQPSAQYNQQFSMTQSTQSAQGKLSAAQEEVFRQLAGGQFYEKSSFFDNISCEAKDGKEGLRNERNWNMETFGVAAPPQTSYSHGGGRGRGGYRGGHRGGYRGGHRGGHGHHSNRGGHQQSSTQA